MILWESEGRDSLHLAHCTSLLKAASAAEAGWWFWFVSTALVGAFAIVPPLNEGKGRPRRWEERRCEGGLGPPKAVKGFLSPAIVAANEASASGFISA